MTKPKGASYMYNWGIAVGTGPKRIVQNAELLKTNKPPAGFLTTEVKSEEL